MKKIFILFLCFILTTGFSFFGKKKEPEKSDDIPSEEVQSRGYVGTLPDLEEEFSYKRKVFKTKSLTVPDTNVPRKEYQQAPRDNKLFVDIIVKKDRTTQYVNDLNDIIPILRKIQMSIINHADVQVFNAQVASLIDHVNYLQDKYDNKVESQYASFKQLMRFANFARNIAILRAQSLTYTKYLAYQTEGAMYSLDNVEKQMNNLDEQLKQIIYVIEQEQ